jgi:DNA-directed RNA polymerase subunit M/transcription elongation factor TFIIS
MIYCICERCNSVVLFQEGEIGHDVACSKCDARFVLDTRLIIDAPVVVEKPGKGRLLKFRCLCGRKIAVPSGVPAARIKCPKCGRMAPVPPWPDKAAEEAAAYHAPQAAARGAGGQNARRTAFVTRLCGAAFLLCLVASAGGVLAAEVELRRIGDFTARNGERPADVKDAVARYLQKDPAALQEADFARYKADVLDKEDAVWREVRRLALYVTSPLAAVALLLVIVVRVRGKARGKGAEARPKTEAADGGGS